MTTKKKGGRPRTVDVQHARLTVRVGKATITAIRRWQKRRALRTPSEAIREMVAAADAATTKGRKS